MRFCQPRLLATSRIRWRRTLTPEHRKFAFCLLFSGLLLACSGDYPSTDQQARNDLGVAQMGRYEYEAAFDTFSTLVDERPEWINAQVNLAIATLNRQQDGDELRALSMLEEVLTTSQDEPRALYMSGIIHSYLGNPQTAAVFFKKVTELDPLDAHAAYRLGQSYLQSENYEPAVTWLQRSIELDPYLRSGYWGAAQALRRIGEPETARKLIEDYQRFESNPAAHTAAFAYKKMGPKAEVISDVVTNTSSSVPLPTGELFAAPVIIANLPDGPRAFSFADLNGDGDLDVYINAAQSSVLLNGPSGYEFSSAHALSGLDGRAAAFADANDDGDVDALICAKDKVELYLQTKEDWKLSSTLPTACTALATFDADHDGDLDVLVTGSNGTELYNNDRDGTYRPIGEDIGFNESLAGVQILTVDLDNDRDLDVFLFGQDGTSHVWKNDRTWRYEPMDIPHLTELHVEAATAADTDADGLVELYLATTSESTENPREMALFVIEFGPDRKTVRNEAIRLNDHVKELALTDIDGDGRAELMATTAQGVVILNTDGEELTRLNAASVVTAQPINQVDGPGVFLLEDDQLTHYAPGPGRHPFLSLVLTGRTESDQMRSNASGIGTRIQVRYGGLWSVVDALDNHSGPGQSMAPVTIGLGGHPEADYIALTWSDGVSQTEISLAPSTPHKIEETQRQLASCPVIFTWDGEQYRFVSDVLGVGGLGFFSTPGVSAEPRPFERFLLPADALQPRDGRYQVKLTEPMEENAYLDQVYLEAVDVPRGWNVTLDERMSTAEPHATGRVITWRDYSLPTLAIDATGNDVTQLVTAADRNAPEPGSVDTRFIGLLANEQTLTLEFEEPLQRENAVLLAEGWVEYPYSQTVFAAWQAGIRYQTATLEAKGDTGDWVTVAAEFGYPAGMPRPMALPLPKLPEGTRTLRLRSNMEIYWDLLQVVYEENIDFQTQRREPAVAHISKIGFPKRTNGPQRIPHYDYDDRAPYWDTKFQAGYYTELGDARALVRHQDGALAIFGGGEEIHLEFSAFERPKEGTTRHLLLDFRGWAKDMDLYTADGETVGPLPAPEGLSRPELARAETLMQRFNTRYQAGLR